MEMNVSDANLATGNYFCVFLLEKKVIRVWNDKHFPKLLL